MPLYEYECEACAHRFEVIQKFSDAPIAVCPNCGVGPVQKLLSSPAIQFKGSGFYLTDYGRGTSSKSETAASKAGKADSGAAAGGDSAKSDSTSSSDTKASKTTTDTSSAKAAPAPAKPAKPAKSD